MSRRGKLDKKIEAIDQARKRADEVITGSTDKESRSSRGLAGEGFAGGYRAALQDVLLILNSGFRPTTWDFWRDMPDHLE